MLDKEIRQLGPEAIKVIQRDGYWVRAYFGQLLHFFINKKTTLCGKTLTPHHVDGWGVYTLKGRCSSCKRKHTLLEQCTKEGSDASR